MSHILIDSLGEQVKVKKITLDNGLSYTLVNYNEPHADSSPEIGLFKSVVFSNDANGNIDKLLSIAPANSVDYAAFKQKHEHNTDSLISTLVVEGTMVSLFHDDRSGTWEIATRGTVGGNTWFLRTEYTGVDTTDLYGNKQMTFRQMFMDCLHGKSMEQAFSYLPNKNCYTFVMKHPNNDMVFAVDTPELYLVSAFNVHTGDNSSSKHIAIEKSYVRRIELSTLISTYESNPVFKLPERVSSANGLDGYEQFEDPASAGIMVLDEATGERVLIENPRYEECRAMRGNHPNLLFLYLSLVYDRKLRVFLDMFPRFQSLFVQFERVVNEFADMVFKSYMEYYVYKCVKHVPKKYFVLAAKYRNEIYLPNFRKYNMCESLTPDIIRGYVRSTKPSKLIYYLTMDIYGFQPSTPPGSPPSN